jgi:hypothetical protein
LTFIGSATTEGLKGLGPGAFLVSIFPGAVLVLALFGLFGARLYPWQQPAPGQPDGLAAFLDSASHLGAGGIVALVLAVLVLSVLIRPFQIAAVQLLEGYWTARSTGFLEALAVERQRRAKSVAMWAADEGSHPLTRPGPKFAEVAADASARQRAARIQQGARLRSSDFPASIRQVLPTRLGNILRRAETSAGERYGLDTVTTYPRLYPQLSARLESSIATQLNLIDVSAALTLTLLATTALSAPLIARSGWDAWRLLPAAFAMAAVVAYGGAQRAARIYADLLHTAYDLHRFDMLTALHRPLPEWPALERRENAQLTRFLTGEDPIPAPGAPLTGRYDHDRTPPGSGSRPAGTPASPAPTPPSAPA